MRRESRAGYVQLDAAHRGRRPGAWLQRALRVPGALPGVRKRAVQDAFPGPDETPASVREHGFQGGELDVRRELDATPDGPQERGSPDERQGLRAFRDAELPRA